MPMVAACNKIRRLFATGSCRWHSSKTFKVLFCGEHMKSGYTYTKEALSGELGIRVVQCSRDRIMEEVKDTDVIVPLMSVISRDVIAAAPQLLLINQYGVGVEGVDLQAAREFGVPVANMKSNLSGNAQSCAEHAIFLALSLLRDVQGMQRTLTQGGLGSPTGRTLFKASVLIYGYGNLGKYLSSRLRGFEVSNICAIGRNHIPEDLQGIGRIDEYGQLKDFARLARDVDIVFLCCSQTRENFGLVDSAFIGALKRGCIIINIARGGLLNYADVEAALLDGRLGGLGIDVYRVEPFDMRDSILSLPNVIATPHVAGVTEISYRTHARLISDNILRVWRGEAPQGVIP